MGAVVEHTDVGCFLLVGFSDGSGQVAFGGLFPDGGCAPGTFDRTDPDGSFDTSGNGRGGSFLVTFDPSGFFGSGGSEVRWRTKSHANGSHGLVITGTPSDGSPGCGPTSPPTGAAAEAPGVSCSGSRASATSSGRGGEGRLAHS